MRHLRGLEVEAFETDIFPFPYTLAKISLPVTDTRVSFGLEDWNQVIFASLVFRRCSFFTHLDQQVYFGLVDPELPGV
jgi:hypothetical protein